MLPSKISASMRLNNVVARTCKYNNQCVRHAEQLRFLCISSRKECEIVDKISPINKSPLSQTCKFFPVRSFSSEPLPKSADVFGDIGTRKYDQVELDEVEKKVENFDENEAKIPRRQKLSAGQYADLIKSHVENGDLSSAENVLQLVKQNRDKPTVHMFNLIIRPYALQGNLKKCFKLYNRLKKHGLKPNSATITSLFNVCSNSLDDITSLEYLHSLRSYLHDKNYVMNATHYNTLAKAYARHRQVEEAFQFLDEMRDKNLPIDETTFNNLLHGATSQKDTGIRYALVVWHLMKMGRVKPSLSTYNLLLRAIRDTNLGDLKVNDVLISNSEESKILISDGSRPDLLATPPVVRSVPEISLLQRSKRNEADQNISKKKETSLATDDQNHSLQGDLFPQMSLDAIIRKNRLILFGGFDGIVKRIEDDDVVPDVKTITLLLDLVPNTKEAEKYVIRYAKNKKIGLDIDFYNSLIKRRCFRFEYKDAKEVLADIEQEGLTPDIFTWGVLALACENPTEGKELLDCLNNIGLHPNYYIYGALFRSATAKLDIEYAIELMDSMTKQKVKPSNAIYTILDNLKVTAAQAIREKKNTIKDLTKFQIELTKFKVRYAKWQKLMKRDSTIYRSSNV